ncbi:MAG: hypothetical protein M0Z28_28110 [Rhodospirillales bacterium]|nr:hypothetical protein [Rhodospirillales bacterium]
MYEIKTPIVNESVTAARAAIAGITSGAMEPKQAGTIISGARALQNAVNVDLKVRLAAPKIAMIEKEQASAAVV